MEALARHVLPATPLLVLDSLLQQEQAMKYVLAALTALSTVGAASAQPITGVVCDHPADVVELIDYYNDVPFELALQATDGCFIMERVRFGQVTELFDHDVYGITVTVVKITFADGQVVYGYGNMRQQGEEV